MEVIKRSLVVEYSAQQMYDLVNDIESYPEFLPWCTKATVHNRTDDQIKATIAMSKGPLKHSFTTINTLQKDKMMDMTLIDGPFKHLEGYWSFEQGETKCRIIFELRYQFLNHFVSMALGPIFKSIINPIVEAFLERAENVYGKKTISNS